MTVLPLLTVQSLLKYLFVNPKRIQDVSHPQERRSRSQFGLVFFTAEQRICDLLAGKTSHWTEGECPMSGTASDQ